MCLARDLFPQERPELPPFDQSETVGLFLKLPPLQDQGIQVDLEPVPELADHLVNDRGRLALLVLPKEAKLDRSRTNIHRDEGVFRMVLVWLTDKSISDRVDRSDGIEQVLHDRRDVPHTDNHIGDIEAEGVFPGWGGSFLVLNPVNLLATCAGNQTAKCSITSNINVEARITRWAITY